MSDSHALTLWKRFRLTPEGCSQVSPRIRASWQRSELYGVDPFLKSNPAVLSNEELARRREECRELLAVALPTITNLFEFVRGSGFVVALADRDGTLLAVLGDDQGLEFTSRANFIEGAKWSEDTIGTNAVGLALVEGRPVQVYGYEHYAICAYNATCSAAPIRDTQGKIIGVLDLTGPVEKAHYHTLGMAVAGAHAVETQLALKAALADAIMANRHNTTALSH